MDVLLVYFAQASLFGALLGLTFVAGIVIFAVLRDWAWHRL